MRTAGNRVKGIFFAAVCAFVLLLMMSVPAFADDSWNVSSIEFIPASNEVRMSSIQERDNDGIYALNLANRGKKSMVSQCFFMKGDKCRVTYNDGSTKEFEFSKISGIAYAEFRQTGGNEKIMLEAIATDVAQELKKSGEVSVDELAAVTGINGVTIEYGEYEEIGGEIVGRYVRTHTFIEVTEDIAHDHSKAFRARNQCDAGCESTGMSRTCVYCQICGRYFTDDAAQQELRKEDVVIPALGHDWGAWQDVVPEGGGAAAEEKRTCSRCPETQTRAKGQHVHTPGEEVHRRRPACTSSGLEEHYVCEGTSGCGALLVMDGSDYIQVTENEIRIPATGHKKSEPQQGKVTPATCSSVGGYNLTTYCVRCGAVLLVERVVLPADPDAHQWGEWTVTKQANETQEGEEVRTCALCGSKETRAVPKTEPESKSGTGPASGSGTSPEARPETDNGKDPAAGPGGSSGSAADKGSGRSARSARTGDDAHLRAWSLLGAAALVLLAAVIVIRRRK